MCVAVQNYYSSNWIINKFKKWQVEFTFSFLNTTFHCEGSCNVVSLSKVIIILDNGIY